MKIFCTFPTVNIKTNFFISYVYCKALHLDNFKGDFLNTKIFLHPWIEDF